MFKETDGWDYMGDVTVTEAGEPCQSWDSQYPYPHYYTHDALFPDANISEAGNKCRNPTKEGRPWCYTQLPTKRWDWCDVPECIG